MSFKPFDTQIKSILFDLDDTLYLERDYVFSGFKAVAKYLTSTSKRNIINIKPKEAELYTFMKKEFYFGDRRHIFDNLLKKYRNWPSVSVKKLIDVYRNHKPNISLPLDSLTVLNQLNKCNLPLALVTDGPTVMQTAKIEVLGIKRFIDHLYITDSLGSEYAKPSTLIFKRVLQDLSIEATKSVYVGDNPYKDFIGAKQVGLKTIRLIREKGLYSNVFLDPYHEAEITIQKIDAIHKYLNIRSFR